MIDSFVNAKAFQSPLQLFFITRLVIYSNHLIAQLYDINYSYLM